MTQDTPTPARGGRPKAEPDRCSVSTCWREAVVKRMCQAHYARWRKTGDVQADVPVRTRPKRFHDHLPSGYWSDVSLDAPWPLFGCVIGCDECPWWTEITWTPAGAVMAVHEHTLRAHHPAGRSHA